MIRRLQRAAALMLALGISILRYWQMRLHGPLTLDQRALWMQLTGRAVLASLQVRICVEGQPPHSGLLVSNHLGYVDIALLSAVVPCTFVSRADVAAWPLFGSMSRWGGTIYLDRSSLASANAAAGEMAARLRQPVPVVLFAEGTSTDGSEVLRLRSRLFQPAALMGAPITAAAVRFVLEDGPQGPVAEREVCFYGDDELPTHLWKVLGLPPVTAFVHFGESRVYADAREAAKRTHEEVVTLRAESMQVACQS